MKHLRFLVLAALVAMPLTACDDDGKKTVEPPVTGTVSGAVTVEGAGVSGVSVTLVGATSQSATTGAGGAYSFTGVEAGSYGVAISDFPADVSFSTVSKTTSITTQGQVATVDFSGSYIRTATVSGNVMASGDALSGVAVTLTGPEGAKNAVTDGSGHYGVSGLRAGEYTVAITVPAGYTFANSSFAVTVGVGEAKEVSFFGEADVVVDPVTANVVIKSVTTAGGVTINPNNVAGQINVTLQVDPGQNDLQKVCVLLDDAEIDNGCQTLGSAVAEQLQAGVLEIVFTIFTNDFDPATGAPIYTNQTYTLSAVLYLENAQQSNVTTSMNLTFKNAEAIVAILTPEKQGVVSGEYVLGGIMTIKVLPVSFSGKTVDEVTVEFPWDDYTVDGPFPATEEVTYSYDDYGFDVWGDDVWVGDGVYSDGTLFPATTWAILAGTEEDEFIFDYEPPSFAALHFYLTDQVTKPALLCCSQNWTGPAYKPADGLVKIADGKVAKPTDAGIGLDNVMFYVDALDDLEDDDLEVLLDDEVIDFTAYPAVAYAGTMADAALDLSLNNDDHDLCAVATDKFGQWQFFCLEANGASNNTPETFGYDNTPPVDKSDPDDSHPNMFVYNAGTTPPAIQILDLAGQEDRSGFSTVPFRAFITKYTAEKTFYVVDANAAKTTFEGPFNLGGFTLPACAADPTNAVPCYPNQSSTDGVWNVNGGIINQAGGQATVVHDYWVAVDQTVPTVDNVTLPATVKIGAAATFSAPVHDNLHVGCTAFSFDIGISPTFIPLGENICNADDDIFDLDFPEDDIAVLTINPAVTGFERATGGTPDGAVTDIMGVRATHTDLAGNLSTQAANNFIAGTVESGDSYDAAGIDAFYVDIGGDVDICNGDPSAAECDPDADELDEFEVEVVAQGPSGSFPNPFAPGLLYTWLVTDPTPANVLSGDETYYLMGTIGATNAVITDEGVGGNRYYTWSFDVTSADVSRFADGTLLYVVVGGFKSAEGVVLVPDPQADVITVIARSN